MIRSNKVDIPKPTETYNPAPTPQPSVVSPTPAPTAVIGPKIRFTGELVGEEDLLIQGQIDGTINLKNNNLTIGDKGVIKANVLAKTITVEGKVEGDLYGKERVAIKSSSNVRGNIVADRVTLDDGAKFRGAIDMDIDAHKGKFEEPAPSFDNKSAKDSDNKITS